MSTNTVSTVIDRHPVPIAGLLAIASIPIHAVLPFWWSHQIAALVLALIAGVYIGFSVVDGRLKTIIIEVMVAIGFVGFAAGSMIYNPLWLPLGYIAHGLWDILHHSPLFNLKMPRWYIPLCAAYDILAGIGLWVIWMLR